jgi:hypothetical protein
MPKSKGINGKKAAGMELKAANKAAKDAAAARAKAQVEAEDWKKGSNTRGSEREASKAQKADEQARKRAEKAALLLAEEAEGGGVSAAKARKAGAGSKKKKSKGGLSLLEETLVGDAEKKAKEAKKTARLKKERQERLRIERETKLAEENISLDPLMANTNAMIGNALTDNGTLNASLEKGEISATGIESALSATNIADDIHPEKRKKALHKAFEERMMPEVKQDYPGLKKSQYQDKIFGMWQKSAENPMNWRK